MGRSASGRPSVTRRSSAHLESFVSQVIRRLQRAHRDADAQTFAAAAQAIIDDCERRMMDEAKTYLEVRE